MQAHDNLTLLINAARHAGDVARKFTGPDAQKWEKPDGGGPVTEADLAVDQALIQILRNARPDFGWLSEETEDDDARLSCDTVFIVDPIDGTRNFIEGGRTWAHSIAIAHKGQVTAGVVYLPMRDMLYAAEIGNGATLNGEFLCASSQTNLAASELLSAKPNMKDRFWTGPVPQFARAYRPSLAYRCALVGQGRFDGMITFRPTWEWDIAAGALIASEAGALVSDRTGKALCFNQADPRTHGILAAAPKVHSALVAQHNPDA